jgi:hypothetical protein
VILSGLACLSIRRYFTRTFRSLCRPAGLGKLAV